MQGESRETHKGILFLPLVLQQLVTAYLDTGQVILLPDLLPQPQRYFKNDFMYPLFSELKEEERREVKNEPNRKADNMLRILQSYQHALVPIRYWEEKSTAFEGNHDFLCNNGDGLCIPYESLGIVSPKPAGAKAKDLHYLSFRSIDDVHAQILLQILRDNDNSDGMLQEWWGAYADDFLRSSLGDDEFVGTVNWCAFARSGVEQPSPISLYSGSGRESPNCFEENFLVYFATLDPQMICLYCESQQRDPKTLMRHFQKFSHPRLLSLLDALSTCLNHSY